MQAGSIIARQGALQEDKRDFQQLSQESRHQAEQEEQWKGYH